MYRQQIGQLKHWELSSHRKPLVVLGAGKPGFDALKDGDLDEVMNIWTTLITKGEVTRRNASAHSNFSTLVLSGILDGTNTDEAVLERGISLKKATGK